MSIRRKLLSFRPIVWLASVRLTLICLVFLFILTLGGTVAQVSDGLYLAQQRYFESFFFLLYGFLPFPGAQSVMWVLFVNLACSALVRFTAQWRQAGIMIIHIGLLLFLASAFVILHTTSESHVTLAEGHASNVSVSYHDWEIALWQDTPQKGTLSQGFEIVSIDAKALKPGKMIPINEFQLNLNVKSYFRNCRITNQSGETMDFESIDLSMESERNTPCMVLSYETAGQKPGNVYLYGNIDEPRSLQLGNKKIHMLLRFKRYPLPFILRLKDFKKEEHPGTTTPRSFESLVEVVENGVGREKLIAMNEPLRFNEYTLYQASFSEASPGNEISTFAVVKNSGRLMPYISTFVTFFGLVFHFGMAAITFKKKQHA